MLSRRKKWLDMNIEIWLLYRVEILLCYYCFVKMNVSFMKTVYGTGSIYKESIRQKIVKIS